MQTMRSTSARCAVTISRARSLQSQRAGKSVAKKSPVYCSLRSFQGLETRLKKPMVTQPTSTVVKGSAPHRSGFAPVYSTFEQSTLAVPARVKSRRVSALQAKSWLPMQRTS